MTVIDKYVPPLEGGRGLTRPGVSGAYALVDADNHLIVGTGKSLQILATPRRVDAVQPSPGSTASSCRPSCSAATTNWWASP